MVEEEDLFGAAVERLTAAAAKAKREKVPFPVAFLFGEDVPTLALLIRGGHGGEVRLKLYLTLTMMATKAPFDLKKPRTSQAWSKLLGFPQETGKRRIADAFNWLEDQKLIARERQAAKPARIALLDPSGRQGKPYEQPRQAGRYVNLPIEFWTKGWIVSLSATAIALLLVLLENQSGHKSALYVTRYKRERYHLSADTWTRATKELESHGLLSVERKNMGDDFEYFRQRTTYWVDESRIETTSPS